jgi:hypothetical protein
MTSALFAMFLVFMLSNTTSAELLIVPGNARAISHALSASRDNATPGYDFTPRQVQRGGLDFAFLGYKFPRHTLRLGFFGLMEIQSDEENPEPWLLGRQNVSIWRGVWGFSSALSFDSFAQKHWGERANVEFAVDVRHESSHCTYGWMWDYEDVPDVGNFIMPEIAVRYPWQRFDIDLRYQYKHFFEVIETAGFEQCDEAYRSGIGGDFVVRYHSDRRLDPFASTFYEYAWGNRTQRYVSVYVPTPDFYLFRQLAGVIIKGKAANLHLYTSWSIGHDKGLLAFHEDRLWGWGIRIDVFGDN